jgi:dTDP-glucose 4,6-dehydratase
MILNCLRGLDLPIYGAGSNVRDWLYVTDHCSALVAALNRGRIGEVYNIGARNERTNKAIVFAICKIMDKLNPSGSPHDKLICYVRDRPGHDFRYAIDPSKIETELGWRPEHSFENALEETVQWYLKQSDWWEQILSGEYQAYWEKQYENRLHS